MVGKRLLFGVIGIIATIVAIIGVWLPGVPTVFPLIIALWAFSKSSNTLERWVERLPILKQALVEARRFEDDHSVDLRVKIIAASSAWISTIAVGVVTQNSAVTLIVAAVALACNIFMAVVPTRQGRELAKEE